MDIVDIATDNLRRRCAIAQNHSLIKFGGFRTDTTEIEPPLTL